MTATQVVAVRNERDEEQQATHARNVGLLTDRVHAIKNAKVDAVASTRALVATPIEAGDNHPAQVLIRIPTGEKMQIGEVAHGQFSAKLGIDKRYYDRMVTDAPGLLAQNLNWWFVNTPEDRLLRMLRPAAYDAKDQAQMVAVGATYRLRGVVGKGYRTIDDADLVDAILPTLVERGATLQEFSIDERRLHAKFFTAARDVQEIKAHYAAKYGMTVAEVGMHKQVNGKDISWVEETISAGVVIRHSEVGFASLGASFVQRVMKCLNDYVADNAVAIRHAGGKNGAADDDVRFVTDTTQLLENGALLSRVQDTIAAQFEPKALMERAHALIEAKVDKVARPTEKPLFEFVGNVGLNLGLSNEHVELLKEETLRAIGEEGGETRFAFVQGITAVARQMTDYDRRLDLERTGFQLLNDDAMALVRLGREAEKNAAKRRN